MHAIADSVVTSWVFLLSDACEKFQITGWPCSTRGIQIVDPRLQDAPYLNIVPKVFSSFSGTRSSSPIPTLTPTAFPAYSSASAVPLKAPIHYVVSNIHMQQDLPTFPIYVFPWLALFFFLLILAILVLFFLQLASLGAQNSQILDWEERILAFIDGWGTNMAERIDSSHENLATGLAITQQDTQARLVQLRKQGLKTRDLMMIGGKGATKLLMRIEDRLKLLMGDNSGREGASGPRVSEQGTGSGGTRRGSV